MIGSGLRDGMELRNGRSQRRHQFEIQTPGRGETVEECVLREAIHLDHPIDRWAGSAKRECSAGLAGDGHDAAVDVRCGAPVEAHLGVTHGATPFGGREIEIIEPDGSLQLVCTLAREEDDGAVCVDPLDSRRCRGWTARQGTRRRRSDPR